MTKQQIHQTKQTNLTASRKGQAAHVATHRIPAVHPAALQRALAGPSSAPAETILHLQRAIGNRAVGRFLAGIGFRSQPVQTKLTVGPAGDQYEQEADRIADQVMNMPAPTVSEPVAPSNGRESSPIQRRDLEDEELQAKPLAGAITPLVRREINDDEELQKASLVQRAGKDEELQEQPEAGAITMVGRGGGEAGAELEASIHNAKSGGQALNNNLRRQMENAFGADFGGVRVHTGGAADQLNRSLQSRAFTTGRDLFFRQGEYDPGNSVGQRLIAHELAHVVQQNGVMMRQPQKVGESGN